MLKDHADAPAHAAQPPAREAGYVDSVYQDGPLFRPLKQVDAADEGALAGAAQPDDAENLARHHVEADALERLHLIGTLAVCFVDVAQTQNGLHRHVDHPTAR